jgi:hypothetical protein
MSNLEQLSAPLSERLARRQALVSLSKLVGEHGGSHSYNAQPDDDESFTKITWGNLVVEPMEQVQGRIDVIRFEAHQLFSTIRLGSRRLPIRPPKLTKIELTEGYLDTIKDRDNGPAYSTVYNYSLEDGLEVSQTLAHEDFEELAKPYPNFGIDTDAWSNRERWVYLRNLAISNSRANKRKSAAQKRAA